MTSASLDRTARAVRSGAATAAAVLVALGAHLAGGGLPPAPLLLAAVLALAWPAALLLVGDGPALWRRAAVVGVAQAMLHGVFALGGTAAATGAPMHEAAGGMAGMHGPVLAAGAVAASPHAQTMWWAHVAAWAATVAAWRWGGAVLHRLLLGTVVQRILRTRTPVRTDVAVTRIPARAIRPTAPAALLAAHRDRGPPLPA